MVLGSCFFTATALAANGTLTGKVTIFGTTTAIASAEITAVGAPGTFTATSDAKGDYTLSLAPAAYSVTCAATGYNPATASATIKSKVKTKLNFSLKKATVTTGTITGAVTSTEGGAVIADAAVSLTPGTYATMTGSAGTYTIANVTAGTYTETVAKTGFITATKQVTISAGATTTSNVALSPDLPPSITSLTTTPSTFTEAAVSSVNLTSVITGGAVASYQWSQVQGPKVVLTATSAASASADVSTLSVAVDTEMVFRLSISGTDQTTVSKDVSVFVQPADMYPILGPNVQIGGSTTAVKKFTYSGAEWTIFNIGSRLCVTPIGMTKGPVYSIHAPGFINDIDLVTYNNVNYALLSAGSAGIVVVNITNPTAMLQTGNARINYYQNGITFTEGGGAILIDNEISSIQAPVAALEIDGPTLYIADNEFGIHKTALANLLDAGGPVLEADGTLLIDQDRYTLQYAGENPWGGPVDLRMYGGKLFVCMQELGLGIFDPATLEQIGRYNLYTDTRVLEDWFMTMDVAQTVQRDPVTDEPFVDAYTGMPDYRQTSFELVQVMRNDVVAPTPWADFDRYGKFYYKTQGVDIAEFNGSTIAYIANALGGLTAVDISGYQSATATNFLTGYYLGYVPAVPANGPEQITGTQSQSILPYYGAGMLKESGIIDVKIRGNYAYMTDHFAGLVIVDNAHIPAIGWQNANGPYNNDTDGIPGNHFPDTEFITSYDMAAYDPMDNESMPIWMYQSPCLLATAEIGGHGNRILLMDTMNISGAGSVDLLSCVGAGGFNFIDIVNLNAPVMEDRYSIPVYFPTTEEIGAKVDTTPGQTISIGHAVGIASSEKYLYHADGPHGISAWQIVDAAGYPTDSIHLVANTLQDEYPEIYNNVTIYPASHAANVVFDPIHQVAWSNSSSLGLRRVDISYVEAGLGEVGTPLLLPLQLTDLFEHNGLSGTATGLQYQDHSYDVEIKGNYAFTADGSNGLTVYDMTKDPTVMTSGFVVANIGADKLKPTLGTASGIALWTNPADGKSYAFMACGPRGVGVVDITDVTNMKLIKVFEPIKLEEGKVGAADGQCVDVKVAGNYAYFSYDSFGVVCYNLADLTAALPAGIDPTEVWNKDTTGTLAYDYRPVAASRFKLQLVPGYEEWGGGAVKMDYTLVNGKLIFYVAFAEAGVLKIDWTDPAAPVLAGIAPTAGECTAVTISNGRLYVADGSGGMLFFK
ncbi:MAG: carboxypeptidase regulatory-like domain-containing protein [Deltaproteobacteria bacterium]|nr:carboxypeptidase regulatory-like domain-containing protein [Deltaproteobacteria bacterium]